MRAFLLNFHDAFDTTPLKVGRTDISRLISLACSKQGQQHSTAVIYIQEGCSKF